jgi:hypothetical protein
MGIYLDSVNDILGICHNADRLCGAPVGADMLSHALIKYLAAPPTSRVEVNGIPAGKLAKNLKIIRPS